MILGTFGSLIRDEQGSYSTSRCAFWLTLLTTLWLIWCDAYAWWNTDLDPRMAELLTTLIIAEAAWAGGPRVAQYLAQIGSSLAGRVSKFIEERGPEILEEAKQAQDKETQGPIPKQDQKSLEEEQALEGRP